MQGRPKLHKESKQISVLVSLEEYKSLDQLVQKARVERPGFSFGDLLRGYVRKCLAQEDTKPLTKLSPRQDQVRRLHAMARSARRMARELEAKK